MRFLIMCAAVKKKNNFLELKKQLIRKELYVNIY